ncbi:MAG: glutamine amidotransferase [Anaerolineae bacterium]|nr:glutamine amidotransferase [Anaerolineae bacterium]
MKALYILKTGSTLPEPAARKGDFEDWIIAGLGLPREALCVLDVREGPPPAYEALSAAVITGSHAMVTEHAAWSERLADWLPGLVARRIPVLGICYGHQLLAYALGGVVGAAPAGPEYGTTPLLLKAAAHADPLLSAVPQPFYVHVSHFQSVLTLPKGATRLASSIQELHQAFVVAGCAWGVQFHPEFDEDIVATYIQAYAAELRERGVDPEARLKTCRSAPHAAQILRRFGVLGQSGK